MSTQVTPANMRRLASQSEILHALQGVGTVFIVAPTRMATDTLFGNMRTAFPKANMRRLPWNSKEDLRGYTYQCLVLSSTDEMEPEIDATCRMKGWGFVHYDFSV